VAAVNDYQCPACRGRGKTWEGSDPRCGFNLAGNFVSDNWNCATLNALRDHATWKHRDDLAGQSIAVVSVPDGPMSDRDNQEAYVPDHYIVLSYYKERCRTALAQWFRDDECGELTLLWAVTALSRIPMPNLE
jgi:hypothetical protein